MNEPSTQTPGDRDTPPARVHLTRTLWITTIVIIAYLAYGAASRFYRGAGFGDFHVFHDAFQAIIAGEDLYSSGAGGYIYPPLFAVLFAPLGYLNFAQAAVIWTIMNAAMAFGCYWVAAKEYTRRFRTPALPPELPGILLVAVLILVDKLRSEFRLGQTDMLVMLGLLLSLRWVDKRPILAGIALGFTGHIKYQSLILVPYLILRGRWKALGSTLVSVVGFALAPALVLGWERNLQDLAKGVGGLAKLFGDPPVDGAANILEIAWIRSISIPSGIARLQEWAGWPESVMVLLTLVAAGAVLGGVMVLYKKNGHALFLGRGAKTDESDPKKNALVAIEWTGLLVAVLIFGPQTTGRHMILMLPVITLTSMLLVVRHDGVRRLPILGATIFFFLALILPPGTGDDNEAVRAWRSVSGISIASLTLLFAVVAGSLRWAATLPERESAA